MKSSLSRFLTLRFNLPAGIMIALALMILSASLVFLYVQANREYAVTVRTPNSAESGFIYGAWPALENADYFDSMKQGFLDEKVPFVEANLSAMTLRVYGEEGLMIEVPIKSKGREGSWWETPSGLYRAEYKERNHFSSFGHVYMPYSIQFQGNFFIHGWPYYPGGEEVPESFSGGCIRLSTEDAENVYPLIERGMPILVFEGDFVADEFSYSFTPPNIQAASYLAVDLRNNFVFLSHDPTSLRSTEIVPRIMTALVASEYQNVEKEIEIVDEILAMASTSSSTASTTPERFAVGETYTVYDLLFPLLLENSPTAAAAIMYPLGEARAVALMQAKARSLGMQQTHFADTTGLSPENRTTAEDIVHFGRYLYNNRPFILRMSAGTVETHIYGEPAFTGLEPLHPAGDEQAFVGGLADASSTLLVHEAETLETESKLAADQPIRDMLAIFELTFRGESRPIAIVLLDSPDLKADLRAVEGYIEDTYR
jgi:hypothetical protein